ncbi:MAG: branched-chain amino acid transaminase [Spirochaetota bacterium]|jgi:branched-chain amino acid aminotransferase|nr:branched-chain amino acid transaminase [Spirochaetota bacterium]
MAFQADKIWFDGKFVDWDKASVHVLSHALHYGTCAFEGVRAYKAKQGAVIMRLRDHLKRLAETCVIYRIPVTYSIEDLERAAAETLKVNKLDGAYIRPFIFRGFGELGVNPQKCPVHTVIAAWDWGKYLGPEALEKGVSVCVSSWRRAAPDTFPTLAKAACNYMNSQLIKLEALENGYDEGLALDSYGYLSEGSGENVFLVKNGKIFTPPSSSALLPGITRHSVIKLARSLGYVVEQQQIVREALYTADEIFLTGTAAEVTPVTKVDKIAIGGGTRGPITRAIQERFFAIIGGEAADEFGWLTQVS